MPSLLVGLVLSLLSVVWLSGASVAIEVSSLVNEEDTKDSKQSFAAAAAAASGLAPRVKVQVYTEALCIDCFHFVHEDLVRVYHLLGEEVIDLTLIPFGNAKLNEVDHSIICQHSAAECDANSWEQCAIYLTNHNKGGDDGYDDEEEEEEEEVAGRLVAMNSPPAEVKNSNSPWLYLSFINCLETALPMGHYDTPFEKEIFLDCAAQSNSDKDGKSGISLDGQRLEACHDNPLLSWSLQVAAAHQTPKDHTGVPWVVMNSKWFDTDHEDLLQRICQEYTAQGGSHPSCTATTVTTTASWSLSV